MQLVAVNINGPSGALRTLRRGGQTNNMRLTKEAMVKDLTVQKTVTPCKHWKKEGRRTLIRH